MHNVESLGPLGPAMCRTDGGLSARLQLGGPMSEAAQTSHTICTVPMVLRLSQMHREIAKAPLYLLGDLHCET